MPVDGGLATPTQPHQKLMPAPPPSLPTLSCYPSHYQPYDAKHHALKPHWKVGKNYIPYLVVIEQWNSSRVPYLGKVNDGIPKL